MKKNEKIYREKRNKNVSNLCYMLYTSMKS